MSETLSVVKSVPKPATAVGPLCISIWCCQCLHTQQRLQNLLRNLQDGFYTHLQAGLASVTESIDLQEASHGDRDMQGNSSVFDTQEVEDCLFISTCNISNVDCCVLILSCYSFILLILVQNVLGFSSPNLEAWMNTGFWMPVDLCSPQINRLPDVSSDNIFILALAFS